MTEAGDLIRAGAQELKAAGIDGALREARLLLAHVLGCGIERLVGWPETPVSPERQNRFQALLTARGKERKPLSRILGQREFWSLNFEITGATLDPRPDSEILVEAILVACPGADQPRELLDLGTGSGCLLLSLLHEWPQARGLGVDISAEALETTGRNVRNLGLQDRLKLQKGDWCEAVEGTFDVILSNPPYIPSADIAALEPEVRLYDPLAALDGGVDGLDFYRRLAKDASRLLKPSGLLALELGIDQFDAVKSLFEAEGFSVADPVHDLSGIARCLLARHLDK